jgi:hypothetical protein
MSAMEPLYRLLGISTYRLSKEEIYILEAELLTLICNELKEFFRERYKNYFRILKYTLEMENAMLEADFVCLIIKDILSSEEYSLEGIAQYADTHTDIIQEIYTGSNANPSAKLLRRIIELHHSVRRDLYNMIMKKVAIQYLAA